MKARREEVYAAVDSEREYQIQQCGNALRHFDQPRDMTIGEHLLCMEKCLADARNAWYKGGTGGIDSLDFVRKVTALGVSCMELWGAPPRVIPQAFDPGLSADIYG